RIREIFGGRPYLIYRESLITIRRTTGCSCIPTVTGRSIANRSTWHNRVPHGAFERLERHAGELARVVLRGLDGSNPVRLPGANWNVPMSVCMVYEPAMSAAATRWTSSTT